MMKGCFAAVALVGLSAFPLLNFAQDKSIDPKSKENTASASAPSDAETPEATVAATGAAASNPTKTENSAASEADAASGEAQVPPPAVRSESEKAATGTYTVRLRDLEDRINRLKEQIFRSKARLSLLAETVLDRKIAGSKAVITFRNEMGGSFKLAKATFLLDGGPIFNKSDDSGSLADREVINLFDGPVMPGDHTLSIVLQYRGHGYGIFSYLRGYQFKTKSSRTFTVNEGKSMKLEVVGYEKGSATTPLEDRPDVRYIMNVADYEGESLTGDDKGKKE
jgi:hypothetical protein